MRSNWKTPTLLWPLLWLVSAGLAQADDPSTLLSRLNQLDERQPIEVRLASELWRADGKGEDREEFEVAVEITVRSEPEGYQLHYDQPLLERLEAESESLIENPDAVTKTSDFMWRLDLNEIRPLLDTADSLRREIQRSEFRVSREDTYNDRPATRLTFDRDKRVVDERMRKYVKQFDSTLEVWVDDQGTPLASRLKMHAKGSLLFVIRGEYREEATHHYRTVNGRLITHQLERWRKTDLPGEHHETRLNQRLVPLQ